MFSSRLYLFLANAWDFKVLSGDKTGTCHSCGEIRITHLDVNAEVQLMLQCQFSVEHEICWNAWFLVYFQQPNRGLNSSSYACTLIVCSTQDSSRMGNYMYQLLQHWFDFCTWTFSSRNNRLDFSNCSYLEFSTVFFLWWVWFKFYYAVLIIIFIRWTVLHQWQLLKSKWNEISLTLWDLILKASCKNN